MGCCGDGMVRYRDNGDCCICVTAAVCRGGTLGVRGFIFSVCVGSPVSCPNQIQREVLTTCKVDRKVLLSNTLPVCLSLNRWSGHYHLGCGTEIPSDWNPLLTSALSFCFWPVGCFIWHLQQFAVQCLFFHRLPKCFSLGDLRAFACL